MYFSNFLYNEFGNENSFSPLIHLEKNRANSSGFFKASYPKNSIYSFLFIKFDLSYIPEL